MSEILRDDDDLMNVTWAENVARIEVMLAVSQDVEA